MAKQGNSKQEMTYHVDENDRIIKVITKDEMRDNNLMHRDSNIFVFDSYGKILVTKRTSKKRIWPSLLEIGQGGTMIVGETYLKCAKREIREEVGISNPKLKFLFKFRYKDRNDNAIANVYKCIYDGKIKFQKSEISRGFFISMDKLKEMLRKNPAKFTPDSILLFRKLKKMMKSE